MGLYFDCQASYFYHWGKVAAQVVEYWITHLKDPGWDPTSRPAVFFFSILKVTNMLLPLSEWSVSKIWAIVLFLKSTLNYIFLPLKKEKGWSQCCPSPHYLGPIVSTLRVTLSLLFKKPRAKCNDCCRIARWQRSKYLVTSLYLSIHVWFG